MITAGKIVKSDSDRHIRVDALMRIGGSGIAYWATDLSSGQKGILKTFNQYFNKKNTLKRMRFLIDQDLQSVCQNLAAPVDFFQRKNTVYRFTLYSGGQSLEELLINPRCNSIVRLQLAIDLSYAINVLHEHTISHGNLHSENIFVSYDGSNFQLYLIDLDNFNAPEIPGPPCVGHPLYIASELCMANAKGRTAIPTMASDLYSLSVLIHELLFLRHPHDKIEDAVLKLQHCGEKPMVWDITDQLERNLVGQTNIVLNDSLNKLFRSALSPDSPMERPTADAWRIELVNCMNAILSVSNT